MQLVLTHLPINKKLLLNINLLLRKRNYADLIEQTFDFPQKEFELDDDNLLFHKIPLMDIIEKYGTPLKFTYLPQISNQIKRAKKWFANAMEKAEYKSDYFYCYCTKSS